jgi:hypothetical protein
MVEAFPRLWLVRISEMAHYPYSLARLHTLCTQGILHRPLLMQVGVADQPERYPSSVTA